MGSDTISQSKSDTPQVNAVDIVNPETKKKVPSLETSDLKEPEKRRDDDDDDKGDDEDPSSPDYSNNPVHINDFTKVLQTDTPPFKS